MNCLHVQECLTEIVDGRPLDPKQRTEVEAHLVGCDDCKMALELERATKNLVARGAQTHSVPLATVTRIRALLDEEDRRSAGLRSNFNVDGVIGWLRARPVWATAAAAVFVVAILYWPSSDKEKRFNESSLSFVQQAISSYDTLTQNFERVQFRSSNPDELRAFMTAQGVNFAVSIPQLPNAQMIGGSVAVRNNARVANVIYNIGGHKLCLCQMNIDEANQSNSIALSDSARNALNTGHWYWYQKSDGRSVGVWQKHGTLHAAISDCSQQEITSLFSNTIQ